MTSKFGCFVAAFVTALGLSQSMALAVTTVTGNLAVTATVLDTCTVTTAGALAFAILAPGAATNETAPAAITVICTAARAAATVALDGGAHAVTGQRNMIDGGTNLVPYGVYATSGHSPAIAINGNIYSGAIPAITPTVIQVYGQVPSGSYNTGVYTDSVVVTLSY